jgi:hypothetical protein
MKSSFILSYLCYQNKRQSSSPLKDHFGIADRSQWWFQFILKNAFLAFLYLQFISITVWGILRIISFSDSSSIVKSSSEVLEIFSEVREFDQRLVDVFTISANNALLAIFPLILPLLLKHNISHAKTSESKNLELNLTLKYFIRWLIPFQLIKMPLWMSYKLLDYSQISFIETWTLIHGISFLHGMLEFAIIIFIFRIYISLDLDWSIHGHQNWIKGILQRDGVAWIESNLRWICSMVLVGLFMSAFVEVYLSPYFRSWFISTYLTS